MSVEPGSFLRGLVLSDPPPSKELILSELSRLASEHVLFGAEVNPEILKKSESGSKFLIRDPPPHVRQLALWESLFGNRILPNRLLELLGARFRDFAHRECMLLFARDRLVYDTRIVHGEEHIGDLTMFLRTEHERGPGLLGLFRGRMLKIVFIENISLREQSSGYASDLFRYYEELFGRLGFHQFRLKASLSVGKYYWAKEGFDCMDGSGVERMKTGLADLVRSKNLPVNEWEIDRLNHAYDVALFRRDLKIPVYRDKEGYYALEKDSINTEEVLLPLGKAFLLSSDSWDGYKVIYTDTPRRTGFIYSDRYLEHRTPTGHVEHSKRLEALLKAIDRDGLRDSLVFLKPYPADREFIGKIHDDAYIESFREAAASGASHFRTRDCSLSQRSYEVALLAAGGVMAGVDAVMNRRVENVFCAVRPPGHHATRNAAMGFCFINNVAVGAVYARAAYGVKRILILDWDVHHGNGTQEIFEEDPFTYFLSFHEHPTFCFPGTGRRMERGKGDGQGATLNIPLRPHAGDAELAELFDREALPEIDRFRPDLIMISAGFDAHRDDPIADIELTDGSFVYMTRRICEAADRHCGGKIVSVLEGGYHRPAFAASVIAHLRTLQGRSENQQV
ncbi:MAG: histone deacetylase [Deltaproteobacteria bacterium]|nr:histone deacetylase [Deltaproteobacteria bacterium]